DPDATSVVGDASARQIVCPAYSGWCPPLERSPPGAWRVPEPTPPAWRHCQHSVGLTEASESPETPTAEPRGSALLVLCGFRLWRHCLPVRGSLWRPVRHQRLGSGGTAAVTTAASPGCPATGVDRPYRVLLLRPATCRAARAAVCRLLARQTGRTGLAGVGRV